MLELDPTTKTYVDTSIADLIDSAPGALDTLNELAAAMGDDANFASTVTNAIAVVQADVDQNEADADAAISAVQADVDQNEADADAAISAVQADVDQNEADADAAIAALQADVDQNEADADAAIAAVQADVDQNEADADAAIAAVQADVDQNEADADAAIALKADKAGDTFTGNVVIHRDFPDLELRSNGEKRILFTDNGGGATGAIKNVSSSLTFFAGGVAGGNLEMTVASDGVDVSALKIAGTLITATAAELNFVHGVTSNIQTQLSSIQADVDQNEADADAAIAAEEARALAAEALLAPLASPALTGTPTAPTAGAGTNTTQLATTAFVSTAVANLVDSAPGALDTLNELAAAMGDDANFATTVTNQIAAVQADVDQNELDADAAISAVQADVDQNEADADAAIAAEEARALAAEAAIQADVDQNEADADAAIALKANKAGDTFTGVVTIEDHLVVDDSNNAASEYNFNVKSSGSSVFGVLGNGAVLLGNNSGTPFIASSDHHATSKKFVDDAIAVVQADVDQNESDADAAIAALQADVDQNEADADAAIAAVQADVDQNEADADAAIAAEEARALAAEAAIQADVDQNEADADAAVSAVQADVDQNEADADAAIAALQADVDQNEADADAAIAANEVHIDNLATLSGVVKDSTDLGTFSGTTIANNRDIKLALQDLESALEGKANISYVQNEIADVIDGAPGALDTLNELAAALNDDASAATNLTNLINANEVHIDNLATLSGLAKDTTDLGTFSGSTIANHVTIKTALQTLETTLEATQADVDQNEADADAAISAVQADVDQNEADADAAIAALQADVDQNESDADAAIAALQADVDQNEADSDAADAAIVGGTTNFTGFKLQGTAVTATGAELNFVDGVTSNIQTQLNAIQADVNQNESDADAAIAAVQADVDQNEADADAAIAAVQADVDQNEADADAAIALKADIASPTFTGTPAAPTATAGTNTTQIATTAFVSTAVANVIDSAPGALDTLNELAAALGDDANFATTITNSIAAVQADVDQNEVDSDAAESALSGRLDTLEADPTTATAVAAVQADVDQNEADADAAIALKLDASAVSTFGGTLIDDADAAAARTTLGLGSAATTDSGDYATAAQGTESVNLRSFVGGNVGDTHLGILNANHFSNGVNVKTALYELSGAIDTLQTDVDTNESDADAAIAAVLAGTSIPGPYADDVAAASGGVAVGAIYKKTNGQLHWRVS